MTPIELIDMQDRANDVLMDNTVTDAERATALTIRTAVNVELMARRRCTVCGRKHTIFECPRVLGYEEEAIEEDVPNISLSDCVIDGTEPEEPDAYED